MKLLEIAGGLGILVLCQVWAPYMLLDLPAVRKLTVKDLKTRDAFTRDSVLHTSPDGSVQLFSVHPEIPGNKITFVVSDKHGSHFVILDQDTKTIVTSSGSSLYSAEYMGSAWLGVALMGLPGLVVCSPLLILNWILWSIVERIAGMDRHELSFYLRVRNQLDKISRDVLKGALQNRGK